MSELLEKLTLTQKKTISDIFNTWQKDLKIALKNGIDEKNCHLLQSPYYVALAAIQQTAPPNNPFSHWEQAVITFKTTQYLKITKKTNNDSLIFQKPLAILRSHKDTSYSKRNSEEACLTLLAEAPSQHNILSKNGNFVKSFGKKPVLDGERGSKNPKELKGNLQEFITPLNKKGFAAFHTGNQFSRLGNPMGASFQRFFLATSPHYAVIKAAYTFGKLAGADAESIKKNTALILKKFYLNLKPFAESVYSLLTNLESTILNRSPDQLGTAAKNSLDYLLQPLCLGDHTQRLTLALSPNNAYPYTFQQCAVSLSSKTGESNLDRLGFLSLWEKIEKRKSV